MNTHEDIITPIIMHCKVSIPKAIEFKSKLGLEQHIRVLTKWNPVTTIIMKSFPMKKYYYNTIFFDSFIDLYFPKHKLAIEVDKKRHTDRNKKHKMKEKKIKEELLISKRFGYLC